MLVGLPQVELPDACPAVPALQPIVRIILTQVSCPHPVVLMIAIPSGVTAKPVPAPLNVTCITMPGVFAIVGAVVLNDPSVCACARNSICPDAVVADIVKRQ